MISAEKSAPLLVHNNNSEATTSHMHQSKSIDHNCLSASGVFKTFLGLRGSKQCFATSCRDFILDEKNRAVGDFVNQPRLCVWGSFRVVKLFAPSTRKTCNQTNAFLSLVCCANPFDMQIYLTSLMFLCEVNCARVSLVEQGNFA